MRNPAFGRWPSDDEPRGAWPLAQAPGRFVITLGPPPRDLLAEAEPRVDRRPPVRRERRPYLAARQGLSGLVEAALRGARSPLPR